MLDLGCGTGLAGAAFRPFVERLVGVDLSPAMIAQAESKGLYDRLVTADLADFLAAEAGDDARYDLVLAADVFVYVNDLAPIMAAVARVLAPDGLFAFTVETHSGDGVKLLPTLRYAHGEPYIRRALADAGLAPASSPKPPCAAKRACRSTAWSWSRGLDRAACRPLLLAVTVLERPAVLPDIFARWFASRGWAPRAHQLELLAKAQAGRSVLLIAPTGGGKTLAGFLPSLVELSGAASPPRGSAAEKRKLISIGRDVRREGGLHTLYISPLKALAVDIARNLEAPVAEMGLPIRIETRTGDTPTSKRQRQRRDPPEILLTTPEQLALLLASADAPYLFGSLKRVILDELHALVTSKRGDLLSLGLARLFRLAPNLTSIGLSATVAEPDELARFMVPQRDGAATQRTPISSSPKPAPPPHVTMLDTRERLPWAGHSARHALDEIYRLIKRTAPRSVFVNTRSQAEGIFQQLWHINDDNLAIALHHGSLDVAQRRKVEGAMAAGACARWCAPPRSISASTGATSISSSMSARRRAPRGFSSASAAPITAWTSRRKAC